MSFVGVTQPKGRVKFNVIKANKNEGAFAFIVRVLRETNPFAKGLHPEARNWRRRNFHHVLLSSLRPFVSKLLNVPHLVGELRLDVIKADGTQIPYGLASLRVVTTAGVNFIVDAFQNITEVELFRFHGLGLNTGDPAEAAGDTALTTELTTQYNPNSTRATGTLTEGASANIFRTVATNTVDEAAAIKEHGIFTQAAVPGGTLLDRSVFAVINLGNGDSLQSTYDLTLSSGG